MTNYVQLSATAQVKESAGKLKSIFVSSGTSPTVTVYDSSASSTSDPLVIATFTAATPGVYQLTGDDSGIFLKNGIYVVLGGTTPKVTIAYD